MKKVIIIGGTTGIGREMAEQFLAKGYAVGISGRTASALESFKTQHLQHTVATACFDVTKDDSRQHLQQMIEALGGMDIFIYCSGIGTPSRLLDETNEWNSFHTNATGFINLTMFAFNYFVANNQPGQIAGISSIAANRGLQAAPAYSATKAFMSNYLEALHFKAFKMKMPISVTDIQPGYVATKMAQGNLFWVVPVKKCAAQIIDAILHKKKRAYISKRWMFIGWLLRNVPAYVIRKFT